MAAVSNSRLLCLPLHYSVLVLACASLHFPLWIVTKYNIALMVILNLEGTELRSVNITCVMSINIL